MWTINSSTDDQHMGKYRHPSTTTHALKLIHLTDLVIHIQQNWSVSNNNETLKKLDLKFSKLYALH